jgi:capsular polysaccharide biosynthesis protein
MLRFTIREMFWLTAAAALSIGWLIHTHSEQTESQLLQIQMMDQRLAEAKDIIKQLQALKEDAVIEEKNLANVTSLPETTSTPQPTAERSRAGGGWHIRIVHRPLSSEL